MIVTIKFRPVGSNLIVVRPRWGHMPQVGFCWALVPRKVFEGTPPNIDSVQNGSTALCVAAHKGHLRVVELLIAARADVNIQTNVREAHIECVCVCVCVYEHIPLKI